MVQFRLKRPDLKLPYLSFLKERLYNLRIFIRNHPIASLLLALGVLLLLIAVGNFLFKAKAPSLKNQSQEKEVKIYSIGTVPKVTTQAQVQNSGVITLTSLVSGVIQQINVSEGDKVDKGANLISLSSNYAGALAPAISQSIAFKQLQQINETFDAQKQIIQKQREMASLNNQNTANLRDISAQSVVDLRAIADLNNDMLVTVKKNLEDLEKLPQDPTTDEKIFQLKQVLNQIQVAQNQAHQQILNVEYQANTLNPPTQLSGRQKDLTLKQLDIQEKSLQLSKDIANLQLALAAINTSLFHPTSPFGGRVEKILVRKGQAVSPGTPLLILADSKQNLTLVAKVPETMAKQISPLEDSTLHLGQTTLSLKPFFVSDVATDGLLYSVFYSVENVSLTDNDYLTVDIPVGLPDTTASVPFVPFDSVFQTQDHSFLYLNKGGVVSSQQVTTGEVLGDYVQITSGLSMGDQVILNRNVVEGDKIKPL